MSGFRVYITMKMCEVCGLRGNAPQIIKYKRKIFLCVKHRAQITNYGYFFTRTVFDKNDFIVNGNEAIIKLYDRHHNNIANTIIDTEDLERVKKFKWYYSKMGYVESIINGKHIKLHIFLIGKVKGKEIDHININPLDNRKSNLRHVTHKQNMNNIKKRRL